jgi:hypothetical protein
MRAREELRGDSRSPEVVAEPGASSAQTVHELSTLAPSALLALQRTVGNAALARIVKTDAPDEPSPGAATEHPAPQASAEAEGEVVSGTIEPLEGEEITTRGCDAHGHTSTESRPAVAPQEPQGAAGGLHVRAHLSFEGRAHRETGLDGKADAVASHLSLGNKVTEGGASPGGGEFGVEKVKYKIDSTTWTADTGKKIVDVSSRVFLDIGWGVHALGRTNVTGAADAAVTKATWSDIVTDLTPSATGRPPRAKYWCQDLTEKHEKFHASDDIGRTALYRPTAEAWLNTQSVSVGTGSGISGAFEKVRTTMEISSLLEKARSNVEADGWAWYGAGGEDRAYADGKSSYQARADAISKRATDEKW